VITIHSLKGGSCDGAQDDGFHVAQADERSVILRAVAGSTPASQATGSDQ